MGKHTPGPWELVEEQGGAWRIDRDITTEWNVCARLSTVGHMEAESYANARLISAAPDLLEALENLVDSVGKTTPRRETSEWTVVLTDMFKARDAIAKAKGETDAPHD